MKIKKYVVEHLSEAVEQIRVELGKDAVILETKPIYIGGFMGMFRKKKIEVTAVTQEIPAQAASQEKPIQPHVQQLLEQIMKTAAKPASVKAEAAIAETTAAQVAEQKTPLTDVQRRSNDEYIMNELKEMRGVMMRLAKSNQNIPQYSEAMEALRIRLSEQEVEEQFIQELTDELLAVGADEMDEEQLRQAATSYFHKRLAPFVKEEPVDEDTGILYFAGPTGAGKTTTIAKLAAHYKIDKGQKVGFITSDTYRIAAVDQLRTYATILDVPIEVVFSHADLKKAHHALEEAQLIFMDTAGRNYRSEMQVSEVNSLFQSERKSETLLVLSLTGKTKDMSVIAERFQKYGVKKVLFTKLDETIVYGAILNLILKYELIPVFIAKGQTVPDDIELFSVEKYVHLLLGVNEYD